MTISAIRFRSEGALLVLQVCEQADRDIYSCGSRVEPKWRDAKTEDLLHVAAFTRAHDTLDRMFESLQRSVQTAVDQTSRVIDHHEQRQL